jgi:hypothetical protein
VARHSAILHDIVAAWRAPPHQGADGHRGNCCRAIECPYIACSAVGSNSFKRQHFLNFLPLPHGHGSFRPTFLNGLAVGRDDTSWSRRVDARSVFPCAFELKQYQPDSSSMVSPNRLNSPCERQARAEGSLPGQSFLDLRGSPIRLVPLQANNQRLDTRRSGRSIRESC